jgi:hypothetical protein
MAISNQANRPLEQIYDALTNFAMAKTVFLQ